MKWQAGSESYNVWDPKINQNLGMFTGTQHPKIQLHVAMQVCDSFNWQVKQRVCGSDRTLLSKKSITSVMNSIQYLVQQRPRVEVVLCFIYDRCSQDLIAYLDKIKTHYQSPDITIEIQNLHPRSGIHESILACYQWMQFRGRDFVMQIQDDYIYTLESLMHCMDVWVQINHEASNHPHCIVSPLNNIANWRIHYNYSVTPRTVITGSSDFWIQIFDVSCSWMSSLAQFSRHWDLYDAFLYLTSKQYPYCELGLEDKSLNYIMTQREVLAISPMQTLCFHVQGPAEVHCYQDWQKLWNTIVLL